MKRVFLLVSVLIICCLSVSAQTYRVRLLSYNEITISGVERIVKALVWFDVVPKIPVFTYFDPEVGKKINIKTTNNPYKGGQIYSFSGFDIVAGEYGMVWIKCTMNDEEFILQDIKELQSDYIGESLAFEVEMDIETRQFTLITYPFEEDFPFKYAETIITKTFDIATIDSKCR